MSTATVDATSTPATNSKLDKLIKEVNIAASLKEDELTEIGRVCRDGFVVDLESRRQWEKDLDAWTKLAMQIRETKTYPWPNAANIKYPILSTAAMQFNARAYPSLIPSDGAVVKGRVMGKDPNGMKSDKADRVATYMSYQLMHEMETWDEEMDRMLIMLPIIGTIFKKTYWSGVEKAIKSELVYPKNLVINNWAKSIETAERVSEVIEMSQRVMENRQRDEIFLTVELGAPSPVQKENSISVIDETTPYEIVEQHTYLDLDDDGLKEPYVVTFHKETGKVLRITARYGEKDIILGPDGKVSRINPQYHYTKFSFVPNPDGSFYDVGFGILLGPINEAVNTLINQLVDSGTIANLQAGFIGKGLRMKTGETKFAPGEWKPVNSTGDDLKKQIVPLPSKEPSNVLFQLMGSLITSGKELASVAEIFVGKMPGQNTPATTTMATIEQGMKVFTAVYKRIYRSLDKEYKKIYRLNGQYMNPETYVEVLDTAVGPDDFDDTNYDICPGADPTAVSQTEKLLKAQGLMELLQTGTLDIVEVVNRVLTAQEQPNIQKLFTAEIQQSGKVTPPPDPKMMELQMKSQIEQQKAQLDQQQAAFKAHLDAQSQQVKMAMEQQANAQEMRHKEAMAQMDQAIQLHKERILMVTEAAKTHQDMSNKQQVHTQKLQQMKEIKSSSPNQTSTSGKRTK
jgi:chaperonin GroES